MPMNEDASLSIHDVLLSLRRHRRRAVGVFLAIFALCVLWIIFGPRRYESTAQLYVRLGRGTATLDTTVNGNANANIYQTREDEVNTARQIADSRTIAEKVVDQLGVETILRPPASGVPKDAQSRAGVSASLFSFLPQLDPETPRNRAIRKIQTQLSIWTPARSSIINIGCQASNPALAQRITQAWTDTFLSEYVRLTHAARSYEFFTKQAEELHRQLADAERALRDAKDQAKLVTLPGHAKALEQDLTTIRTQTEVNLAAASASRARAQELSEKLARLAPQVVLQDTSGVPNHAWELMRARLYEVQTHEAQFQAKYTDAYAPLAELREQRRNLEDVLKTQNDARQQSTLGPNPTYQTLEQELLREQAAIAARAAEGQSLRDQYAALQDEMKAFNDQSRRIGELERQVDILQTEYRAHAAKMEESRMDEAIEHDRITSVNVTQPASYVETPVSPQKKVWLLLGLMAACCGALAAAVVSDRLSPVIIKTGSIENVREVPMTTAIGREPPSTGRPT